MPVPRPEELVASYLQQKRSEAEAEHRRRVQQWEEEQRARFEEGVRAGKERIRHEFRSRPAWIIYASRFEAAARAKFEAALAEEEERLQAEFEEGWRRFEEAVKPELLRSAEFWVKLGYPEYALKYAPVELPPGAVVTRVEETPGGVRVEYVTAEQQEALRRQQEELERQQEELERQRLALEEQLIESLRFWESLGHPEFAGKYAPVALPPDSVVTRVEETEEGLKVEYMTREQFEELQRQQEVIERQLEESRRFWEGLGYPEYGGRYAPVPLPEGAKITKVEETAEGLKVEYLTREQLEELEQLQTQLKASEEFWSKMGYPEYAGKYAPVQLPEGAVVTSIAETPEGLRIEYKTREQIEAEREIQRKTELSREFWVKLGYPEFAGKYEPIDIPEGAKITKIEETAEGLKVEYLTREQLEELQNVQKQLEESRRFWESVGYPEYAGKYMPVQLPEGAKITRVEETAEGLRVEYSVAEQQPVLPAAEVDQMALLSWQFSQTRAWLQQQQALAAPQAARAEEPLEVSPTLAGKLSKLEYIGAEPVEPVAVSPAVAGKLSYLATGETRLPKAAQPSASTPAQGPQVLEWPQPVPSLSKQALEWAEGLNIPVVKELAKFGVGVFAGLIDYPAVAVASGLSLATGRSPTPVEMPELRDPAYSMGVVAGAVAVGGLIGYGGGAAASVISGGRVVGMSLSTAVKASAVFAGVSAAAAAGMAAVTRQEITVSLIAESAMRGAIYGGVSSAAIQMVAAAAPKVVASSLGRIGVSAAIGGAIRYAETKDVEEAMKAAAISAVAAGVVEFLVRPAYYELKAKLGFSQRLEPGEPTIGKSGKAETYETYLKNEDVKLRVVADVTEKPLPMETAARMAEIESYAGRRIATAHATLDFQQFAKPGEDILLKGFPSEAAGFRREWQLYHFYSAPGSENVITVYGGYMGVGEAASEAPARIIFGGKPGAVATLSTYITPELLPKPGETVAEYFTRFSLASGKTFISPETVMGFSVERQLSTPAAYVRFGVELPGSYYHVERVLPKTFQIKTVPELLKNIPVLRTLAAKYIEFKVALGEFRATEAAAAAAKVSTPEEAAAAAKAAAGMPVGVLSSAPAQYVSPFTLAAVSVSSPLRTQASPHPPAYSPTSQALSYTASAASSPASSAASETLLPAASPPRLNLEPLKESIRSVSSEALQPQPIQRESMVQRIKETHRLSVSASSVRTASLSVAEAAASKLTEPTRSTWSTLSSPRLQSSAASAFAVASSPALSAALSSGLQSSQSSAVSAPLSATSTPISVASQPLTASPPAFPEPAYSPTSFPSYQPHPPPYSVSHPSAKDYSMQPEQLKRLDLGRMYVRPRPIAEFIEHLRAGKLVDPHEFRPAPPLRGRERSKRVLTQLSELADRLTKASARALFKPALPSSRKAKPAASLEPTADLSRRAKPVLKLKTPDVKLNLKKALAGFGLSPPESRRRKNA
ncbi:MAG: hypothetical protein QXT28_06900 [Thermofilaceae archaeon]